MNEKIMSGQIITDKTTPDKTVLDKIMLQGMRFYGYHGCKPDEKTLGQWFEIDVELYGDFSKAAVSDLLEDTLNYSQAYKMIKNIVEGPSVNLIEHLAQVISDSLLELPLAQKVWVRVKKPQVPLKGPLDFAGIELVRWKNER